MKPHEPNKNLIHLNKVSRVKSFGIKRFPRASAGFQSLRLDIVCRRLPLVSFGASTRVGRLLLAGSSRMSQLPPLSSLLHLADLLGEKGFQCWDEPGEDFKLPEANLRTEEMEKMTKSENVKE